ncbi:CHAT domain-containing protein [Micromonospora sp. CPCC 206060]|uniref:CHAT domain-containing protein n=1 Tax=Micromonospora sp. CPCC 206060 TaxID=3122406 RepID=UPI002FF4364B
MTGPDGPPEERAWLLIERYESGEGQLADLDEAVEILTGLCRDLADDVPPLLHLLLGIVELYRFDETGASVHLLPAAAHLDRAVATGTGEEWHADAQGWLGLAYARRWAADDDRTALDRAVDLLAGQPAVVPDAMLGLLLFDRYEAGHDPADLDRSIGELQRVQAGGPEADARYVRQALGMARAYRWESQRQRDDLDAAAELLVDAEEGRPELALLHGRILHERAVLDRDVAALEVAVRRLGGAADLLPEADRPVAVLEAAVARWNGFRLTGDTGYLSTLTDDLDVVLARPGLDPEVAQMLRLLQGLAWSLSGAPERGARTEREGTRHREMWQTAMEVMRSMQDGTAFADGPSLPDPPARYRSLWDPELMAEQRRSAGERLQEMAPDDQNRPRAVTITALLDILQRMLRTGVPTDSTGTAIDALREAQASTADPETARLIGAVLAAVSLERGAREGDVTATEQATEGLTALLDTLAPTDPMYRAVRKSLSGALFNRFKTRGDLHDLARARDLLREMVADPGDDPEIEALLMRASLIEVEEAWGVRTGDPEATRTAVRELERLLPLVPAEHPGRLESEANLALFRSKLEMTGQPVRTGPPTPPTGPSDPPAPPPGGPATPAGAGVERLLAEAALPGLTDDERAQRLANAALALAVGPSDDPGVLRAAAAIARQAVQLGDERSLTFPRLAVALGTALHGLYEVDPDPAHLVEATSALDRGRRAARDVSHPDWSVVHLTRGLVARLGRSPAQRGAAREMGLLALRGNRWRVLLQSGTEYATLVANEAVEEAVTVAGWCLNDGDPVGAVAALDSARGAVLHSATVTADIPAQLTAEGADELAARWRRADTASPELRHEVMKALTGADRMLDPPGVGEIQAALRTVGADALVYLTASRATRAGGAAVVVPAQGTPDIIRLHRLGDPSGGVLDRYVTAHDSLRTGPGTAGYDRWRQALDDLLDWAGEAVLRPLLDRGRFGSDPWLMLVPMGRLGLVPWHAARIAGQAAVTRATWSYAVSARLLVELAGRPPVPADAGALIVGDPEGVLPFAGREACAIREVCYPQARYLGQPASRADGPGVPAEVLDWLVGGERGTLHLACHGVAREGGSDTSYLVLAGGQRLTAEELIEQTGRGARLGLVSLAACTTQSSTRGYDEAFSLATAFLVAGARSAFGSLWRVPDQATSLLMFMTHRYLRRYGLRPVEALRRAQLWMLDPARRAVAEMPPDLVGLADQPELADPVAWSGFTHVGV